MSSRGKHEFCRMCGGALKGNQRRWLFGGLNKKAGPPQTPTESLRGGSLSRSSQSSPWGSISSLGSSMSLSKSQLSLNSPSKGMDLLSVLTHILGQCVPRGHGQEEFVCGKCMCVLERVFKFDTVISRVRVLSSERLQKLMQERDKIRQWVRQCYYQRNPRDLQSQGSTSEEDGDGEKEGYREMLKENMALSEYECWSEKWDTCPYFIRTGKRCRKGKGCEGCDSLRVSDSDYESVCGVPRRLPFQPFSPLALTRDKSQSMPLHWQRMSTCSSSPSSLAGSTLSLQASSRTASIQSLDSLDCNDPFDSPGVQSTNFVLKELRSIEGKPVSSPSGSKIPVLGRKYSDEAGEMASPSVNKVLIFGNVENGGEDMDAEDGDILSEPEGRVHASSWEEHLWEGQLDQALSHIRTLEAELKHGRSKPTEVNGAEDWAPLVHEKDGSSLLQSLGLSLHSRERLIQECMGLIRRLCVEEGGSAELANKLAENLKETTSANKAGRDREKDLDMLNTVLQCNQDIINDLREKDALIQELESCCKDTQGLAVDREGSGATLCKEVEKLTKALQEYQDMVQNQQQSHSQTVSSLSEQLKDTRQALREKEKEKKEADRVWQNSREDRKREERKLRDSLEKRDKLIEQILVDAEERDHLSRELQQNLQNKPLTGIKHTL
ncbi:tRNA (pseudouridine(54)-N(1))-methyltransferase [Dissostichus eleginoides]|uniref:tRNA (Pseudouridine(54)-N(1))-methyltransferase n=1 Tax=Dissostichus eleginoides TaxID=100907 RepID=A0AAD9FAV0_DISEL|nr:tRNA (pseudouridine(54)-N(1))-methyltransferase [Dissostichus eleginoides]